MNIIQKPINFIKEVKAELGKVAWSTRQEILGSTMVVITITIIMSLFIGVIDVLLTRILRLIFK